MSLGPVTRLLAASGAELVALAEHFYRRAFAGALLFVAAASAAAVGMLPLRDSASHVTPSTPTVALTIALAVVSALAVTRATDVYLTIRADTRLELVPVVVAAALLAYPLRSELWWPSCALLMLVALVAPLARTWLYCVAVLAANLAAHAFAGDLGETPAVSIVGLWVGFGFWPTLSALFSDRIAAHLLRLDVPRAGDTATRPVPPASSASPRGAAEHPMEDAVVVSPTTTPDEHAPWTELDASPQPVEEPLQRLTARQLEIVAMLADGHRQPYIAACLSISTRQVQRHIQAAIRRLGVHNVNELVAVAVGAGMVRRDGERQV